VPEAAALRIDLANAQHLRPIASATYAAREMAPVCSLLESMSRAGPADGFHCSAGCSAARGPAKAAPHERRNGPAHSRQHLRRLLERVVRNYSIKVIKEMRST